MKKLLKTLGAFIALAFVLITFFNFFGIQYVAGSWDGNQNHPLQDWDYRFKITTDSDLIDHANDVLFYDLSYAPEHFWENVGEDGGDIRITSADGETEVAREITNFQKETSGDAESILESGDAWYDPQDHSSVLTGNDTEALYRQPIATLKDLSGNGYDLTQDTAANQPLYLRHGEDGYLGLSGTEGHYASLDSRSEYNITGDIDLRAKVSFQDINSDDAFVGKYQWQNDKRQYLFRINSGNLRIIISDNGTSVDQVDSSSVIPFNSGEVFWARVTLNITTGDIIFYTSTDGETWTQLGTTQSTSMTELYTSDEPVTIGSASQGQSLMHDGRIYQAQIFDGIDGTKVLDANFEDAEGGETTWTNPALGDTITTHAPTNIPNGLTGKTKSYLHLPGESGNYASTPSQSKYNITGDIDLRGKVSFTDMSDNQSILAKRDYNNNWRQYIFRIESTGKLELFLSGDSGEVATTSSVALPFNDNEVFWVRAAWSDSANEVTFYTSLDGETWTQLGTTQSLINTNLHQTSEPVTVGAYNQGGTAPFNGQIFQAQIRDGIDGIIDEIGLSETLTDATSDVYSVNFNHDSSLLAVGGDDNNVYIYDTSTWNVVETLTDATSDVYSVNFNDDGSLLAVGGADNNVRIYNTSTWAVAETLTEATGIVLSVNFNHDSSLLAVGSGDDNVRIYNTTTWNVVETLTDATSWVYSVNFNHDSSLLAAGDVVGNVRIYNTSTWSLIETLTEATAAVYSVNFNHDSSLLAVGGADNNVRIYNTSTWAVAETLTEATGIVLSVNFNHDSSLLAVGSGDDNVRIYNTTTWNVVETLTDATATVPSVNFNHDSSLLAAGDYETNVRIYDTDLKADLVYDANFEDLKHGVDSFTENEGATVTVNRSGDDQALVVGRSMLWFDGVDDYLGIANAPAGLRKPYQEIVGVGFNFGIGDNYQRMASRATGGNGENGYAYYFHNDEAVRYDISRNTTAVPNAYPIGETFIGVAYINGTNRVIRTNGEDKNVESFTGTISNVADEFRIGSDAGFTFEREWNGFLGPIFIKGRDTAGETLSDNDRNKLEKYYADPKRYNITLPFPSPEDFDFGTGSMYFKADGLQTTSGTEYYIYYGNENANEPSPSASNGRESVWSSGYEGVWHFDEGEGGTTMDSTSAGNTGTLTNGPSWVIGQLGMALQFDGVDDWVDLTSLVEVTNDFTVSLWSKLDESGDFSEYGQMLLGENSTTSTFLRIRKGDEVQLATKDDSESRISWEDTGVDFTQWRHIVLTRSGTNVELFIDGVSYGVETASNPITVNAIGQSWQNTNYMTEGVLDEIQLKSTSVSSNYVNTQYKNHTDPQRLWFNSFPEGPDVSIGGLRFRGGGIFKGGSILR